MIKLTSILVLMMSFTAFAQQRVVLSSSEVFVNDNEAILVRTASTPKKVKVTFQVPMGDTVCTNYETRQVYRTSSTLCGYDYVVRNIRVGSVCVRSNPVSGRCVLYQDRFRTERVMVPRSCYVPESYCTSYGTAVRREGDSVKFKFKNLPILGGTEEDTFLVKARQKRVNGGNVVYEVTPQQTVIPYEVKSRGFLGSDKFVIKTK